MANLRVLTHVLAGTASVTTSYTYDLHDNKLSETDPKGNATSYAYDDFDRVIQVLALISAGPSFLRCTNPGCGASNDRGAPPF
jgi:YD repeat-containing protein